MIAAMQTALAGLQAAEQHLNVAALNIANMQSTGGPDGEPYHALEAVQYSTGFGAPVVIVREKPEPTLSIYGPTLSGADADGFVEVPNINLVEEIVDLRMAQIAYLASLAVFKTAVEMNDELLELFA